MKSQFEKFSNLVTNGCWVIRTVLCTLAGRLIFYSFNRDVS